MTAKVMNEKDHYLDAFDRVEAKLARSGGPAVHRLRTVARDRFARTGFPGPRDEEWRFTPLGPFLQVPFQPADGPPPDLPRHGLPQGVLVCSLEEAWANHADLVSAHLGRYADDAGYPFTALNTAFLRSGVFVYVPAKTVVEQPVDLRFSVPSREDDPLAWFRRVLVVVGEGSQLALAEMYGGPPEMPYHTNAVTEIVLGDRAVVDHYKLQEEGNEGYHVSRTQVQLGRAARFTSHAVNLGGAWVRNDVNAVFAGEGSECTLNGLYQGRSRQLVDNHTFIDHAVPHCASHELYKGVLDGRAHGVFNGKILVRPDAQKTDAKQTNKALLLSDDATINTKPQLEIYADDVKCTHGATVGNLDAEQVFYLRSRGVGEPAARALLTFAFANDIIGRIRYEALRTRLEQQLLAAHHLPTEPQEAI